GGRTGAPKFPLPNKYEFLMEYYYHTGEEKALQAVKNTLDNMANGGIYDHLGGGFARYSTDEIWKVPHFEKMLYDNGQLVSLYSLAYQLTGKPLYKKVVYETLEFIKNELTSSEGGFYSSLDADSEGEEGKFYVWEYRELAQALSNDLEVFADYYSVSEKGNWEGNNILYRTEPADKIAEKFNLTQKQLNQTISESLEKLKEIRSERIRPPLDDKILTSWNALMLKGYLDAYRVFGDPEFLEIAVKNAKFIKAKMLQSDFRLYRNYKDGKSTINGFLDDYSFTINAFISLYQATFEEEWLLVAKDLLEYTLQHFYDEKSGAFFYTSSLDDPLIARKKELTDNVIPGSNSAMAKNLITLGNYFYVSDYKEKAQKLISMLKLRIMENPGFHTNWGMAMIDLAYPIYEVAIVGDEFMDKRAKLDKNYLPNAILMGGKTEGSLELLENKLVDDQTFIYVCLDKACKLPTTEVKQALTLIK
ncbi:MAG: thioredoxin domain-containing protein, partial [Bacteroidetes bacterium]|nr:thioredoxin domain-containing protein [Bacteroidota bacterium]